MIVTDLRVLYLNPEELKEAIIAYVKSRYNSDLMINILENNDCTMLWSKNMKEFIVSVKDNNETYNKDSKSSHDDESELYSVYGGD